MASAVRGPGACGAATCWSAYADEQAPENRSEARSNLRMALRTRDTRRRSNVGRSRLSRTYRMCIVRAMAATRGTHKASKPSKPAKASKPAKPAKPAKPDGKGRAPAARKGAPDVAQADPALFDPLTPGEVADALRTLT